MMIGGIDLVLDGASQAEDWTILQYEIKRRWPNCIFYKGDEGEWFACRDRQAYREFLKDDPTGNDAFIHVIMGDRSVTLVVDPPFEELGREVLEGLKSSR